MRGIPPIRLGAILIRRRTRGNTAGTKAFQFRRKRNESMADDEGARIRVRHRYQGIQPSDVDELEPGEDETDEDRGIMKRQRRARGGHAEGPRSKFRADKPRRGRYAEGGRSKLQFGGPPAPPNPQATGGGGIGAPPAGGAPPPAMRMPGIAGGAGGVGAPSPMPGGGGVGMPTPGAAPPPAMQMPGIAGGPGGVGAPPGMAAPAMPMPGAGAGGIGAPPAGAAQPPEMRMPGIAGGGGGVGAPPGMVPPAMPSYAQLQQMAAAVPRGNLMAPGVSPGQGQAYGSPGAMAPASAPPSVDPHQLYHQWRMENPGAPAWRNLSAAQQGQWKRGGRIPTLARGGKTKNFHPGGEKGKLHRELGIPVGEKIGPERIAQATHSRDPEIRRDAIRARTMSHWKKG